MQPMPVHGCLMLAAAQAISDSMGHLEIWGLMQPVVQPMEQLEMWGLMQPVVANSHFHGPTEPMQPLTTLDSGLIQPFVPTSYCRGPMTNCQAKCKTTCNTRSNPTWQEKMQKTAVYKHTVEENMAMDGLIVLIWQILASDDGDEHDDGDGGRPEKGYGGID